MITYKLQLLLLLFFTALIFSSKMYGQKPAVVTAEDELHSRIFNDSHKAVMEGDPKEFEKIYKKETDPLYRTSLLVNSFHQAIKSKKLDIIGYILNTDYVTTEDYLKGKSLLLSLQESSPEIAAKILETGLNPNVDAEDDHGNSPFLIAVNKGFTPLVRSFIGLGIDLKKTNIFQRNALLIAVGNSNLEITKILLEQKSVGVYQKDLVGKNALHIAASCNEDLRKKVESPELLKIFLKLGFDPNSRTAGGTTPSMLAALYDCSENLKILLQHKADPNLTNFEGQTAIFWGAVNGNIESLKLLAPVIKNIDLQDRSGKSAIMYTIERGHKESYYFLKPLSNLFLKTKHNESSLMLSIVCEDYGPAAAYVGLHPEYEIGNCESIYPNCFRDSFRIHNRYNYNEDVEILHSLIRSGLDVNHRDIRGETAIFRAAICGSKDYITLLLENKAKIDIKNSKGKSAMDFAKEWKRENVLDLLKVK